MSHADTEAGTSVVGVTMEATVGALCEPGFPLLTPSVEAPTLESRMTLRPALTNGM